MKCQPTPSSCLQKLLKPMHLFLCLMIVASDMINGNSQDLKIFKSYRAEIGGNVSFECPVDNKNLEYLYLQKDAQRMFASKGAQQSFVNGYHSTKPLEEKWPNTKLDPNNRTVHMFGVNLSHSGDYDCHIGYEGKKRSTFRLKLTVTATFSQPSISKECDDNQKKCKVKCSSYNGYPNQEIKWNSPDNSNVLEKYPESNQDPITKTFNISSTVVVNCSADETIMSCSVDNRTSYITTCEPPDPYSHHLVIIIAVGVLLFIVLLVAVVLFQRRKSGVAAEHQARNESSEEEMNLTELNNV